MQIFHLYIDPMTGSLLSVQKSDKRYDFTGNPLLKQVFKYHVFILLIQYTLEFHIQVVQGHFEDKYMELVKSNLGGEIVDNAQREFVSGLQSLGEVVDILMESDVNDSTPAAEIMKTARNLSLPIYQAHEYLTKSLGIWEDANAKLSELIEGKVGDISSMKTSISNKVAEIEGLKRTIESLSEQIRSNENQLEEARGSLQRANDRLREQRDELEKRQRDQAIVAGVGAGISWIPIVGWIAGPTMLVVSFTAMEDAIKASQNNVESAEGNVRSSENLLTSKKNSRDDLQRKLSQENREKGETERKLEMLEADLRRLREEQKSSLDVQEKLRNTCHFMTKISGKSNVLKMETSNAYSLEPVFTPLKEIAMMFNFEEHDKLKVTTLLLNDLDFTCLSLKLKAICEKTQDETDIDMLV